jgi:SAM-dependent methyltransferase
VGSHTRESWLKIGQMQFDYLVWHGLKPGMRMLEIGCGNLRAGRLFIEHLDAGDYHGIDISPDILLAAQRTLAEAGLQHKLPHLTLVQDLKLEFLPAGYFDVVHAHSVFSHSPVEVIDECLEHVGRVMKPGGFFDFTFDRTEGAEHHVLREDFYYRTETLVALAGRHGLTGQFMKDWEELPHPQSKLRISRPGELRYAAVAVPGERSCHGGDRRGRGGPSALVHSVQPGHSALGPEVLAVVRASATGTGTTNPHPAGQDLGPHVVLEQPHPRLRAELPDRRLADSPMGLSGPGSLASPRPHPGKPDPGPARTISITLRVRRTSWNVMKPRIQCVPTQ